MIKFSFATDSQSGTVEANDLQEAYDKMRAKITDEMIEDGATLWVEAPNGERITLGIDGE